ncbi:MAG: hypothetical protein JSS02_32265 [Planctomycetes bacterium]|nr:hypothetical protein [Planctomycetota bacterium]
MTNPDLELYDANPEWGLLLSAYQQKFAAGGLEWSPRIQELQGIAPESMSVVHGKLIALGFLKVEVISRTEGLQYQLTTLGRQAVLPPAERVIVPEWMQESEAAQAA